MLNETITFLSGVDRHFLTDFFGIIGGVIAIFMVIFGILRYMKPKKDFSDQFIFRKAKKLQQSDFAIQQPLHANAEAYKGRGSDDEIEKSLKSHESVLVIGMPESGKTRSIYQAIKAVLPDFFVIKVLPKKVEQVRFPFLKRNYLAFFDDLNNFVSVNFDFNLVLKRIKEKSKKLIVVSTCRSGDEFKSVKDNSMQVLRTFTKVVDLDEHNLNENEGRELAEKAGVTWKPGQFIGTPGSVIFDVEVMKNRYRNSEVYEKTILRACKLLKQANIFIYEKELIKEICTSLFGTKINESSWIDSITHLKENSLVTKSSILKIDVYDSILESLVDDYDPLYHFEALLNLLIKLKDAEKLLYLGNAFYKDKDYWNGEKSYKECLRIKPDYAEAHYNLGLLLADSQKYEEAEKEYREAIGIKPDYAEAHYNLGLLLTDLKRYDEAEEEYREAIRIKPDYAEAHYNLGLLLTDLKRYDEAEEKYGEAIRIKPDYAEAHYNLGFLLADSQKYDEAEEEYREAITALERYEEAEEKYREAIRIKPDDTEAHYNLGLLLDDWKRYAGSLTQSEIERHIVELQKQMEQKEEKVDYLGFAQTAEKLANFQEAYGQMDESYQKILVAAINYEMAGEYEKAAQNYSLAGKHWESAEVYKKQSQKEENVYFARYYEACYHSELAEHLMTERKMEDAYENLKRASTIFAEVEKAAEDEYLRHSSLYRKWETEGRLHVMKALNLLHSVRMHRPNIDIENIIREFNRAIKLFEHTGKKCKGLGSDSLLQLAIHRMWCEIYKRLVYMWFIEFALDTPGKEGVKLTGLDILPIPLVRVKFGKGKVEERVRILDASLKYLVNMRKKLEKSSRVKAKRQVDMAFYTLHALKALKFSNDDLKASDYVEKAIKIARELGLWQTDVGDELNEQIDRLSENLFYLNFQFSAPKCLVVNVNAYKNYVQFIFDGMDKIGSQNLLRFKIYYDPPRGEASFEDVITVKLAVECDGEEEEKWLHLEARKEEIEWFPVEFPCYLVKAKLSYVASSDCARQLHTKDIYCDELVM